MGELIEKLNCCGGGPPKRTLQIKKKWKIDEINFDFLLFCCASRGVLLNHSLSSSQRQKQSILHGWAWKASEELGCSLRCEWERGQQLNWLWVGYRWAAGPRQPAQRKDKLLAKNFLFLQSILFFQPAFSFLACVVGVGLFLFNGLCSADPNKPNNTLLFV